MNKWWVKCIIFLTVFLVVSTSMCGCVWYKPNIEWSDTRTAMFKSDPHHYAGQMAVCYDERIYYVSGESGQDGLHSMKPDGTDVCFEFELPMITRLIATPEAFYYVGVYEVGEKNHKYFALYEKQAGQEAKRLPTVYEYAKSVYDAYVSEDGTIAVLETHYIGTSMPTREFLEFMNISSRPTVEDNKYFHFVFYNEVDSLAYSTEIIDMDSSDEPYLMANPTVIDVSTGEQVMSSLPGNDDYFYKLLFVKGNEAIISENNTLVFIDRFTREVNKKLTISGTNKEMNIDRVFPCNNGYLAILKHYSRNNEQLYYINTQLSTTKYLMNLNDKVLIDARDGEVLFAQGNFIRCQAADENGMGEMIYEIKMPGNVVAGNVFEIAGDWLFVHKRALNAGADTHQLQYKVNLKTGEIVDVR